MKITLNHIYLTNRKKKLVKVQNHIECDEQILLTRLSQGDRKAFWQLWIRYQQYIYYCCHRWMKRNYDNTEYAFNQVMLNTWNQLPNAAGKMTHMQGWLSRIASNTCIEIRKEHENITQHIDRWYIKEEDMAYTSRELEYYIRLRVISKATIACSEWEKYMYLSLEKLASSQE